MAMNTGHFYYIEDQYIGVIKRENNDIFVYALRTGIFPFGKRFQEELL